jgi:D-aspartate ligase
MITSVYILGNHIQALGLSRLAAKIGIEVSLFNDYGGSVTRFSNTCSKFYRYTDLDDLLKKLLEMGREKNALLVPTNDKLVRFLADNYDQLAEKYYLSISSPDSVDICYNKRKTYLKAKELGMPIPESYFPDNIEEVNLLADQIQYPVIIKPAVMHTFHSQTGKKVFFCTDKESLISNYNMILQYIPADEVIIQQFLKGGAKTLYSFGTFSANGDVYAGFIANRIRQKPMDFGISTCFAKTVDVPEIEKLAMIFLKGTNYFGFAEVEFMYDEETNEYRLIEINPRTWKWHSIADMLGINLLEMMIKYLHNQPVKKIISRKPNIGWIERLTDSYVVAGELLKGKMSLSEYFSTILMEKKSAVWSWRDPMPGIMYILLTPYLFIKRN